MSEYKQLGVFWGKNNLYFVAIGSDRPNAIFSVPLPHDSEMVASNPSSAETISLIQSALRQQKITLGVVNVSLPTRDIIFRSFIIPWMQPNEIKGVVDFEASKYVPFALDELAYSFYPMTVTDGNMRRIRIILVAIKKEVLENYKQTLELAGLHVNIAEPATLSLIRTMASGALLPKNETIALIEMGEETGNIIVVDNHLPQFVREFHLRVPGLAPQKADPQASMTRMMNEVRISLNYFNRQEERLKVKRMFFLSSSDAADIVLRLEEDLHIPASAITTDSVLAGSPSHDIHFLKAYGTGLFPLVALPADLNFSESKAKVIKLASAPELKAINYKTIMATALICLPLIFVLSFLTKSLIAKQQTRTITLDRELASFKEVSVEKLQLKNETLSKKLSYFKKVAAESDIAAILATIPHLLPEGVWLEQVNVVYPDIMKKEAGAPGPVAVKGAVAMNEKPVVDIQGYAYANDPNHQFKLVNDLLANFKANKELSEFFDNIDFESIQVKSYEKYPTTFFHLICQ